MKSKTTFVAAILAIAVISNCGHTGTPARKIEPARIRLQVSAPKVSSVMVPIRAIIKLPEQFSQVRAEEISVLLEEQAGAGATVPGQIVMAPAGKAELWWILPQVETGRTSSWTATLSHREKASQEGFSWKDQPEDYLDLLFEGSKVVRYMYAYDESTPERVNETYKPYHHVYDAEGANLLTKGPGGLYTHHRGIFIGWSKVGFGGEIYNQWGMNGVAQRHQEFLQGVAGPVLASSESLIDWNDPNGEPIIAEQRRITVFHQQAPSVLMLDLHARLKAVRGDVYLDGDPEHGGFQFRAHNDVSRGSERAIKEAVRAGEQVTADVDASWENARATYLFHADGVDPGKDQDLPWTVMSFGLNSRRYSVQHMNHPDNPKQTLYSANRDYGRFGAFFQKEIGSGETLVLDYRIWVVEGDVPEREVLAEKYSAFVDGPQVEVLSYD